MKRFLLSVIGGLALVACSSPGGPPQVTPATPTAVTPSRTDVATQVRCPMVLLPNNGAIPPNYEPVPMNEPCVERRDDKDPLVIRTYDANGVLIAIGTS